MKLYGYWRSSAVYRVRIALNLKGLEVETVPVHLLRDGGEQHQSTYREINPQGLVPALEHGDGVLSQSLAILEFLEERFPEPPLLPDDPVKRAQTRAIVQTIACDIHPLNNLRVQQYLADSLNADKAARDAWSAHWIAAGFAAIESILKNDQGGKFCIGNSPTMADVCLIPQVYNARRLNCDLQAYPIICDIEASCAKLEAFSRAAPEIQPDAPITKR